MDVDLKKCGRCMGEHLKLRFEPLQNPSDKFAWWAMCPTLNQPVLLARVVRCQCGQSELPLDNVSPEHLNLIRVGEAWTIGQPDDWTGPWPPDEGAKLRMTAEMRSKIVRHYFGGGKICGPEVNGGT